MTYSMAMHLVLNIFQYQIAYHSLTHPENALMVHLARFSFVNSGLNIRNINSIELTNDECFSLIKRLTFYVIAFL